MNFAHGWKPRRPYSYAKAQREFGKILAEENGDALVDKIQTAMATLKNSPDGISSAGVQRLVSLKMSLVSHVMRILAALDAGPEGSANAGNTQSGSTVKDPPDGKRPERWQIQVQAALDAAERRGADRLVPALKALEERDEKQAAELNAADLEIEGLNEEVQSLQVELGTVRGYLEAEGLKLKAADEAKRFSDDRAAHAEAQVAELRASNSELVQVVAAAKAEAALAHKQAETRLAECVQLKSHLQDQISLSSRLDARVKELDALVYVLTLARLAPLVPDLGDA
ncbi:MAG TPA: hypothetical protein VGV41_17945 [Pseudolabrys sp.]|uniref:hypothetical protein n=1 Tax=Pseudolabrys sp. TaxID=1960880 RepID=UPI002DDD9768|nr:hypothetical protein [Pseudolabrys sp.]HEV2630514.1 hypothetical protein [Pseudolabrys sp.]